MDALDPAFLTYALIVGYLLGVTIETPVLLVTLSSVHSKRRKFLSGIWLTACTYPFVAVAIPYLIDPTAHGILYKAVAEIFAPLAECGLFWFAYKKSTHWTKGKLCQDICAIVFANLTSFGAGELITAVFFT